MLSSWPNSVLHCIPLTHPSHSYQISSLHGHHNTDMKMQHRYSNWSTCFLPCILRAVQFSPLSLLHLPRPSLPSSYLYQKVQPALPSKIRSLEKFKYLNNRPSRCDLFSLLYFCRQLYVFRVLTPIIRSSYICNYSFWYWLTGSTTIRSRCWVGTDSCVSYGRYSFVMLHNKWIPTVRYTWDSSNSTTRADGSRSG